MSCGLISLSDLKVLNGLAESDVSQDAALKLFITAVTARIQTFCGRTFAAADYTEYLCGTGDKYIALKQRPINTVASVYQDDLAVWGQGTDNFAAGTLLTAGTDYAIVKDGTDGLSRCGMLYRCTGVWTKFDAWQPGIIEPLTYPMYGNIRAVYNAGYATIPADLQLAAATLIAQARRIVQYGGPLTSESFVAYSYQIAQASQTVMGGMPNEVASILSAYRNIAVY